MADDEIRRLQQRIKELKEGFEGSCTACEPVGVMNRKLLAERDEARREVCELKSLNFNRQITPENYALLRKWDCFNNKENA
jgi:hypothetical protein